MNGEPTTADAIVIGSGIVGAGVAYELARGGRDVVVVDRQRGPGLGSTSASSAIVRFHYSTFEGIATAWEAKFGWEEWSEYLGLSSADGTARYHRTGVLNLDFPDFDTTKVEALFERVGVPYERLTAVDLADRFPALDTGSYYPPKRLDDEAFWGDASTQLGALFTPDGGFVDDAYLAARNLLDAAVRHGARPVWRRTVTDVVTDAGRVAGVQLDDGTRLSAPIVVNCAGPHSAVINRLAGVLDDFRVTTRPLRQEVHQVFPAPDNFLMRTGAPVTFDGDAGTYFRPEPGAGILVGGMEPACDPLHWLDDPDDPDGTDITVTVEGYEANTVRLARRMPELTLPNRPKGVVGVYDTSTDWIPIYDRTCLDGFYVAIGTSGNQFKNAPVIGQLMACLIDGVESGRDHDRESATWRAPHTGHDINLGHYSRLRIAHDSSASVLG